MICPECEGKEYNQPCMCCGGTGHISASVHHSPPEKRKPKDKKNQLKLFGGNVEKEKPKAKPLPCTRTVCMRDGEGLVHKDLIKGNPKKYSNYCSWCQRLINRANNQRLIVHPDEIPAIWEAENEKYRQAADRLNISGTQTGRVSCNKPNPSAGPSTGETR